METRSILAIFAHPDDEAFTCGGTLARYTAAGVRTVLVCATRGEAGEISDPALATRETLAGVREAELRCAADAIGIAELIFLGYRDSGMDGTPENRDPRAFMNATAGAVVPRLVGIIRRHRPQVVLTFDPSGGYGHPDHIAIHRHTVAAFHAAPDRAGFPEQGAPWQPDRLFYPVFPRSFFQRMLVQMEEAGIDTGEFSRFRDRGWPDDQIHAILDVSDTIEAKWAALRCHRTQFGPNNAFRRLPEAATKRLMSREHFVLAAPAPEPGLRLSGLLE